MLVLWSLSLNGLDIQNITSLADIMLRTVFLLTNSKEIDDGIKLLANVYKEGFA